MCDTGYSIKRLVADLRDLKATSTSEARMAEAAEALARRLAASQHMWLRPHMCVPNERPGEGAGIFTLHEEPDHSLAVFVVTWLPGDETPAHNHATWAVIAGLKGKETNHWWKRVDDGSTPGYADVRRAGSQAIDPFNSVAMAGDAIHSLHNDSDGVSITLHLYGMNVDFTDRRQFDPARHTMAPYKIGGTTPATAKGDAK
jgi:predicted metal-dependent enzyme (double-stranded beta helix superfamily)